MKNILENAYNYGQKFIGEGELVNYIPALGNVDKNKSGVVLINRNGELYKAGDTDVKFSIMSIVKIVLYAILLENYDFDYIRKHIGVQGSSKAYNSIVDLEESENKLPVNPFINAGALMSTYFILKKFENKRKSFEIILDLTKKLTRNPSLEYNEEIYENSKNTGYTNLAIAYTMQKNGVIASDVDVRNILDIYNKACTIMVDTNDLAYLAQVISNNGKNLENEVIVSEKNAKILRTIMAICGTYNFSGDLAVDIGIPAKSGVGGGIVATTRDGIGIATYSPGLDSKGNSLVGIKILKKLSEELNLSIY
ncbi:glutaminase A [Peptoniphilus asaccharolyticus]